MGFSMFMFSVFTFIVMNYSYHQTTVSTEIVINSLRVEERQNNIDVYSLMTLVSSSFVEETNHNTCGPILTYCSEQDEEGYFPINIISLSKKSDSLIINDKEYVLLLKEDANPNKYHIKIKEGNRITRRIIEVSEEGDVDFSVNNEEKLQAGILFPLTEEAPFAPGGELRAGVQTDRELDYLFNQMDYLSLSKIERNNGFYDSTNTYRGFSYVGSTSPNSIGQRWQKLFDMSSISSPGNKLSIGYYGGSSSLHIKMTVGGFNRELIVSNYFYSNQRTFVAVTQDTFGKISVYRNGALFRVDNSFSLLNNVTYENIYFGKSNTSGEDYYHGIQKEIGLFAKTLDGTEIQDHFIRGIDSIAGNNDAIFVAGLEDGEVINAVYNPFVVTNYGVNKHPFSQPLIFNSAEDDYVRISEFPESTTFHNSRGDFQGFSFLGNVKFNSLNNWSRILDFGGDGSEPGELSKKNNNIVIGQKGNSGTLFFRIYNGKKLETDIQVSNFFTEGTNVHLGLSLSSSGQLRIYKDGRQAYSKNSVKVPVNATRENNFLGRSNWGDSHGYLDAELKNVVVFNRALYFFEMIFAPSNGVEAYEDSSSSILFLGFGNTVVNANENYPVINDGVSEP